MSWLWVRQGGGRQGHEKEESGRQDPLVRRGIGAGLMPNTKKDGKFMGKTRTEAGLTGRGKRGSWA